MLLRAVQRSVLCELVQLVLQARAQLSAVDHEQNGALHLAVTQSDPRVVRLLLEQRCEVDAVNHLGRSAVHLAAATGSARSLRILSEFRADLNKRLGLQKVLFKSWKA